MSDAKMPAEHPAAISAFEADDMVVLHRSPDRDCPRRRGRRRRRRTARWPSRDAGQKAITALADVVPNLIGGSGDLDPSTRTTLKGLGDFESPLFKPPEGAPPTQGLAGGPTGYAGRNIHFGIREHAMAGIATGMALHGGVLPVDRRPSRTPLKFAL
jgi:transketolase